MKVKVTKKESGVVSVPIYTEFIKLQDAMKLANIFSTGGTAKLVIQDGLVTVNGEICTMRGKKLYPGDTFTYEGQKYLISIHAH